MFGLPALDVVHGDQALGQSWRELFHKSTPILLTHLGLEAVENLRGGSFANKLMDLFIILGRLPFVSSDADPVGDSPTRQWHRRRI